MPTNLLKIIRNISFGILVLVFIYTVYLYSVVVMPNLDTYHGHILSVNNFEYLNPSNRWYTLSVFVPDYVKPCNDSIPEAGGPLCSTTYVPVDATLFLIAITIFMHLIYKKKLHKNQ